MRQNIQIHAHGISHSLRTAARILPARCHHRTMATMADTLKSNRAEGSIGDAFASLSNRSIELPTRFRDLKQELAGENGDAIVDGWRRLLDRIHSKAPSWDSSIIPEIPFAAIQANNGQLPDSAVQALKEKGTIIIRGIVSPEESLQWKQRIRDYVQLNRERTTGFPAGDLQVYELYWSKSQLEARSHPNMLLAQTALNQVWSAAPSDPVDTSVPVTYCDRVRIRTPGDKSFNLGPHLDGGSLERWEDLAYRKCYSEILRGEWEKHDPFTMTHRLKATVDMYHGPGGCSAFRSYQGWLSLSDCSPRAGTLRVLPDLLASTAYTILRPFVSQDEVSGSWLLDEKTTTFHGAAMGAGQELTASDHPYIYNQFVSIPRVQPGDAVFWHCDVAHMVENEHRGSKDSSVLYIPAMPLCEVNAVYLRDQRKQFLESRPPPDFPGGVGESQHVDRGTVDDLSDEGRRAMGCVEFEVDEKASQGRQQAARRANAILF